MTFDPGLKSSSKDGTLASRFAVNVIRCFRVVQPLSESARMAVWSVKDAVLTNYL